MLWLGVIDMLIGSIWSEIHAAAFSCFKIPMFFNFNLYLISNMSYSVNSDECTRTRLQTNGFVVVHSYLLLLFLILYIPVNNFSVVSGWVFLG